MAFAWFLLGAFVAGVGIGLGVLWVFRDVSR